MAKTDEYGQSGLSTEGRTMQHGAPRISRTPNVAGHLQDVGKNQAATFSTMGKRMAAGRKCTQG